MRNTLLGRWRKRRRAKRRLHTDLAIWYHHGYCAGFPSHTARAPDLDLERGEKVLARLSGAKLLGAGEVRAALPVSMFDLQRFHTESYLERVGHAEVLAPIFGLEPGDVDVEAVLAAQRRACGGTAVAADWAAAAGRRLAFNLGAGFHHAAPDSGGGFCVFNDAGVAIRRLRAAGFEAPIAIVDLDFHQGDGALVAFADDPTVFTFSMHGATWSHVEAVASLQIELRAGTLDGEYLETLRSELGAALERHRSQLVFYIAGNDVLAGDALGSFALSQAAVLERDLCVLGRARKLGASVVLTMGGGYSPEAWLPTAAALRWALTGERRVEREVPPKEREADLRLRFSQVFDELDPLELQRDPGDLEIDERELVDELAGRRASRRILGYYSSHGVELALERYGILGALRQRGFRDLRVKLQPADPDRQRLSIVGRVGDKAHLLLDLIVRRRSIEAPPEVGPPPLELLSIEWLTLQDPTASFSLRRPKLPGQEYPGLGLVREIVEMLYQACRRLELDGIVIHPAHYHVAAVGAQHCFFLDPVLQGRFDAMRASLADLSLADASELMDRGVLRDGTRALSWVPGDFVVPVSDRLRAHFEAPAYRQARAAARGALRPAI